MATMQFKQYNLDSRTRALTSCGMAVTYLADSKNYIDNQLAIQAQAQEEALATMLLLLPEETQAAMIENDTNNLLAESEE